MTTDFSVVVAEDLRSAYEEWASRAGVIPWEEVVAAYRTLGRIDDPTG